MDIIDKLKLAMRELLEKIDLWETYIFFHFLQGPENKIETKL